MAAGEWADRGTARADRGRDSEWVVAEVRAAGREAQAGLGAAGPAVARACGILARQAAAAEALARVGLAGEVAPEVGPVEEAVQVEVQVVQAEEAARAVDSVAEELEPGEVAEPALVE